MKLNQNFETAQFYLTWK